MTAYDGTAPEEVPDWSHPDRTGSAASWDQLHAWVDHLRTDWGLDGEIVACWDRHPVLVADLSALWCSHDASYGPLAGPHDALQWVEALARSLERWRLWGRSIVPCSPSGHQQDPADDVTAAPLGPRSARS